MSAELTPGEPGDQQGRVAMPEMVLSSREAPRIPDSMVVVPTRRKWSVSALILLVALAPVFTRAESNPGPLSPGTVALLLDGKVGPAEQARWAEKMKDVPAGFDQAEYSRKWMELGDRVEAAIPSGPDSPEAQALYDEWQALLAPFTAPGAWNRSSTTRSNGASQCGGRMRSPWLRDCMARPRVSTGGNSSPGRPARDEKHGLPPGRRRSPWRIASHGVDCSRSPATADGPSTTRR